MFKDSLESSHAISVEVNEPGETSSLFDKISYDKGSSIIRMMSAFLTEQTFKKGVSVSKITTRIRSDLYWFFDSRTI